MTTTEKIQAIYDAERNASISWFWDRGFDFAIGDAITGFKKEKTFDSFDDGVDWLYREIIGTDTASAVKTEHVQHMR